MGVIITIIGILLGAGGLVFAILTYKKSRKERLHRQQRFEWNHIYQGVRYICQRIQQMNFVPDFLIAVPGAGLIPTELAVIELGDRIPIFMIQQVPKLREKELGWENGTKYETEKWAYWIPSEILQQKEKKVLIFDDYAPTGDTLTGLKKELVKQGFKRDHIKTAALVAPESLKETSKNPDFTWFWVDSCHVWMPWGHGSKIVRKGDVSF